MIQNKGFASLTLIIIAVLALFLLAFLFLPKLEL